MVDGAIKNSRCLKILINGIVQGVGFRPYIYAVAQRYALRGYVLNDAHGVEIVTQGESGSIAGFLRELKENPPPLADIVSIETFPCTGDSFSKFTIRESRKGENVSTLISPDVAVCDDCLKELFDPADRRYLYPFINCTNCGPRYTIIDTIPYDRCSTSMKHFTMCPDCQREYEDPADRRFHAQPDACPECGPRIILCDNSGKEIDCPDPVFKAADLLQSGKIVAVKGLGGFHLACDATNDVAVTTLRRRKHREEKPLAVMADSLQTIRLFAYVSQDEKQLLVSPQRPIVLLKKKVPNSLSGHVAPDRKYFGAFLPYTPLHYMLLDRCKCLVMTSGNISEEPIATGNNEALEQLGSIADYFVMHNRDIYVRNDDSVYGIVNKKPYPIRRSRGFVPVPIFLKEHITSVFGCGAELKNTICLTKGNKAFISQHVGDLENYETFTSLDQTYNHLKEILEIEPEIAAYDLHPDYLSTKYAHELTNIQLVGVQHHHAHIVSCLAEHKCDEEVVGIVLDGTGFGLDGTVWGGEILIATIRNFERVGHFEYVPMPGGKKAIKEPWRMALSYLYHSYGEDFLDFRLECLEKISDNEKNIVGKLIERNVNAPLTSSCGRLFDGVAALTGLKTSVRYEGQAAIELENVIPLWWKFSDKSDDRYEFSIEDHGDRSIIRVAEIIKSIVSDVRNNERNEVISYKFHNTLIEIFREIAAAVRTKRNITTVVLSGGCFQNVYLVTYLRSVLENSGFTVYCHERVPTNDGGISLGQAICAGTLCK